MERYVPGLSQVVLADFLDGIDVCQENRPAAVFLKPQIVENFLFVLSVFCSFLELVPFVSDDLAA